ncbi:MAG: NADH-quinone oxidoreductase subunit K [Candidatus Omnitrophota bacterium]
MLSAIFVVLLLAIGIYCILATYNLLRVLIGIEILIKAVTLLIIAAGRQNGNMALAQAMVVSIIVMEVVIMTIAVGVVLGIHLHSNSLDSRNIRKLKG